jgi:hypothetical protein
MDRTPEQIAERAYHLYLERGRVDGHDLEDWLRAEAELVAAQTQTPTLHIVPDATPRRRRKVS